MSNTKERKKTSLGGDDADERHSPVQGLHVLFA